MTLTLSHQTYSLAELADPALAAQPGWSDNQRSALRFCAAWLQGQQEFVVHTSGSTGAPKPIALTRVQMEASARATAQALGLRAGMAALVCLPVRYIAGQMMLVRGMALDLSMYLVEPGSDPLAGWPPNVPLDFTAVVPLQLSTLLARGDEATAILDRMHAILVGGAGIGAALERQVQALAAPVYHTYGMTETATHVALRRVNGPEASSLFRPLPGVEIDVDGRGCLRVRGTMTRGEWVQTNDVVEVLSFKQGRFKGEVLSFKQEGLSGEEDSTRHSPPATRTFRFVGRWDAVVNSGGVKVVIDAVEQAVDRAWVALDLPPRRWAVVGLPDERLGQVVSLIVEGEALTAEQQARLLAALDNALDRFQRPRRVETLPRLPETATGKIDRAALAQIFSIW